MKTKLLFTTLLSGFSLRLTFSFCLLSFVFFNLSSQVPQGFNYQAIARNNLGDPITDATIKVKLSILSDSTNFFGTGGSPGAYIWEEEHINVKTNAFGLFTIVLGNPLATKIQGTAASFSSIPWSQSPLYVGTKIANPTTYKIMGSARLWSVPYSMIAGDLEGAVKKLAVVGEDVLSDEALFEVKRKDGETMFAVYNHGVRVFMPLDTLSKSRKGGFAIGGFDKTKGTTTFQDYFVVNPDSIRAYIDTNPGKSRKGGFAIGSFDKTKTWNEEYLRVTRDSTRIYINDTGGKALKGGFAIGGFDKTKGGNVNFLNVETNTTGIINPSQNRILWYPIKNAFLAGKVLIEKPDSVGVNSFATGYESKAKGQYSQAMGYMAIARGDYSTAIGKNAVAGKINSFAFGDSARATNAEGYAFGRGAFAEGFRSFAFGSAGIDSAGLKTGVAYAKGDYSFAIGQGSNSFGAGSFTLGLANTAVGDYSLALGYNTSATGYGATTIGYHTTASGGQGSTAMGWYTRAVGTNSTTMGNGTIANGGNSTAIGYGTKASGSTSTAMGSNTEAAGSNSTAFGNNSYASGSNSTSMGFQSTATGENSISMGYQTLASGYYSTAMGSGTTASAYYSTAMGYNTIASSNNSTSMGWVTKASGNMSTSMGASTIAKGWGSTAMGSATQAIGIYSTSMGNDTRANGSGSLSTGWGTNAKGNYSVSMGFTTTAIGNYSTASGFLTKSKPYACLAFGQYNDSTCSASGTTTWVSTDPLFIAGNGTDENALSNAFTILKNGNTAIGHAAPTQMLDVNGNARFRSIGSGAYIGAVNRTSDGTLTTATSDIREKDNINTINNSLSSVMSLRGISFTWKSEPQMGTRIGFVAQEVEQVLPELVFTNPSDGLKGVNYAEMTAVIVEAMKEQQHQILSQQQKIENQQTEIDELKKLISTLIANQAVQGNK